MKLVNEELTDEERGIIGIVRLNKSISTTEVTRSISVGRLTVKYNRRSSKNLWGRFGGGWNWKLGVMIGGRTVIADIVVFSLRFEFDRRTSEAVT